MQRVLDLDLDFFIDGPPAHWKRYDGGRLDSDDNPPWPLDRAIEFLAHRCNLNSKLPGFVVEHHGELFARWRDAINAGILRPPFELIHVDAHADLGLGEIG